MKNCVIFTFKQTRNKKQDVQMRNASGIDDMLPHPRMCFVAYSLCLIRPFVHQFLFCIDFVVSHRPSDAVLLNS